MNKREEKEYLEEIKKIVKKNYGSMNQDYRNVADTIFNLAVRYPEPHRIYGLNTLASLVGGARGPIRKTIEEVLLLEGYVINGKSGMAVKK